MPRGDEPGRLWTLVAQLERDTAEDWRRQHYASFTAEEAFATRVNAIETTVCRRPGGNITVTIAVIASNALEGQVDIINLQRAGNRLYKVVEPDSTAG